MPMMQWCSLHAQNTATDEKSEKKKPKPVERRCWL